jgi:hypothetical protein
MKIRGAGGLGDALYLHPVVKHYATSGNNVELSGNYPDIFADIQNVNVRPFCRKAPVNIECTYTKSRAENNGLNQYEDTLRNANITENYPFTLNLPLEKIEIAIPAGKKICIVKSPYARMRKGSICNEDIQPRVELFNEIIDKHRGEYFFIDTGGEDEKNQSAVRCDLDLRGKTNIKQLLHMLSQSKLKL